LASVWCIYEFFRQPTTGLFEKTRVFFKIQQKKQSQMARTKTTARKSFSTTAGKAPRKQIAAKMAK